MRPIIKEMLTIVQEIGDKEELGCLIIEFKHIRCGRARYNTGKISIPYWVLDKTKEFAYYYIIHEVTHFIAYGNHGYRGHRGIFREIEQKYLREYNIIPIYSRAYVKGLANLKGNMICDGVGDNINGNRMLKHKKVTCSGGCKCGILKVTKED